MTAHLRAVLSPPKQPRRRRANLKGVGDAAVATFARVTERVLPPAVLYALLWPVAAIMAVAGHPFRRRRRRSRELPWPVSVRERWRDRIWFELTLLTFHWRDRLGAPRWRSRCRIEGLEHLHGQPVVLVTVHVGPILLLPALLRMRGYPVCALGAPESIATRPPIRARIDAREDAASGLGHVPRFISTDSLWEVNRHLKTGGILIVAADGATGKRTTVDADGLRLSLGRGTLRTAQIAGADVVPCVIRAGPGLSSIVHIGAPLPEELVTDRARHEEAYSTLLSSLLREVRKAPGQCRSLFWRALTLGADASLHDS